MDNQEMEMNIKHNVLLNNFNNVGNIVYIIKVKTLSDKQYIVKIGESRVSISTRFQQHRQKYDECIILDCFIVSESQKFERFIHSQISKYKVTNLDGHTKENELFLIGDGLSYTSLLKLINDNVLYYSKYNIYNDFFLQSKSEINNENNNLTNVYDKLDQIQQKMDNNFTTIMNKLNKLATRTENNFQEPLSTIGPRLQKINPDNFELIEIYETVSECLKENKNYARSSISNAIQKNTIYNGYRWMTVDREFDPNVVSNLKPTVLTINRNAGYVAKLNNTKTEILNVYIDRKTASLKNGYISPNSLDDRVRNYQESNGYFYKLYEACSENLKADFEKNKNNNRPIVLYYNGIGQYDMNMNLINEYKSRNHCFKEYGISNKTLNKSIDKNLPYNGYFYKEICNKIMI